MIFPRAVQGSMGGMLVMKWIISVFFDAVSVRWMLSPQHEACRLSAGSPGGKSALCSAGGHISASVISPSLKQQQTRENLLLWLCCVLTFCLELAPASPLVWSSICEMLPFPGNSHCLGWEIGLAGEQNLGWEADRLTCERSGQKALCDSC